MLGRLTKNICEKFYATYERNRLIASEKNKEVDFVIVKYILDEVLPNDCFNEYDLKQLERFISGEIILVNEGTGYSHKPVRYPENTPKMCASIFRQAKELYIACREEESYGVAIGLLDNACNVAMLQNVFMQDYIGEFYAKLTAEMERVSRSSYGELAAKQQKLITLYELKHALIKNADTSREAFHVMLSCYSRRNTNFQNELGQLLTPMDVLRFPRKGGFFCIAPTPKSWSLLSQELDKIPTAPSPQF